METTEVVKKIRVRLATAQRRQKSYTEKRIKPLNFYVEDSMFLNVAPLKGVNAVWKD